MGPIGLCFRYQRLSRNRGHITRYNIDGLEEKVAVTGQSGVKESLRRPNLKVNVFHKSR